jgi:hypothetical protein
MHAAIPASVVALCAQLTDAAAQVDGSLLHCCVQQPWQLHLHQHQSTMQGGLSISPVSQHEVRPNWGLGRLIQSYNVAQHLQA